MKNRYKIILSLTILSLMSVGWGNEFFPNDNNGNNETLLSYDLGINDYVIINSDYELNKVNSSYNSRDVNVLWDYSRGGANGNYFPPSYSLFLEGLNVDANEGPLLNVDLSFYSTIILGLIKNEDDESLSILTDTNDLITINKKEIIKKEDRYTDFEKELFDCDQLAYKITANSLYGQIGAKTSPIYYKSIAASNFRL